MDEKYLFFESAAKRFKAELRLYGAAAAIHIENKNDEVFWGKMLKYAYPNGKFRFISASRAFSGAITSGCTQCLQYKPFLDRHLWIAIDSDYRYLSLEPDIDVHHYILQTYTYSFENHFCYWKNAQRALNDSTRGIEVGTEFFDWKKFLTDYSNIVYPLLVWQLFLADVNSEAFPQAVFHRLLSLPLFARINQNNGDPILQLLKQRAHKLITHLRNTYPDAELEPYQDRCTALGLFRDNAYLFVRGHQLYDLMCFMGRKMRGQALQEGEDPSVILEKGFESHLLEALCFDEYDEIRKIVEDIHIALGLRPGRTDEGA